MRRFLIVLFLISVSPASHAFFPRVVCWAKSSDREKDQSLTPITIEYIDDGMIEVAYKELSCELDWTAYNSPTDKSWGRFKNNNTGSQLGGQFLSTRCASIASAFLNNAKVDIAWLDLSGKIIDEDQRNIELEKSSPEFLAQLGFFKTMSAEGMGTIKTVVQQVLSCKIAEYTDPV